MVLGPLTWYSVSSDKPITILFGYTYFCLCRGSMLFILTRLPCLMSIKVAGRDVSPGSREYMGLKVAPMLDGGTLTIPVHVVNGERDGPVNDLTVMSNVAPRYAPDGRALICANVIADAPDAEPAVRDQLASWFGPGVSGWGLLRRYVVRDALPAQAAPASPRVHPGIFACGDYRESPSLQGAMVSGRRAAEAVLAETKA